MFIFEPLIKKDGGTWPYEVLATPVMLGANSFSWKQEKDE
jgi:hypothetical protein